MNNELGCNCRKETDLHGCVSDVTKRAWYCHECKGRYNINNCLKLRTNRKGKLHLFREQNGIRYCSISGCCPLKRLPDELQGSD